MLIFIILATCNIVFQETFAKEENRMEEGKKYTTKYDNIDIDGIIKSERLLKVYVGCLLDRNPCTPDAMELKSKYTSFKFQVGHLEISLSCETKSL